MSDTPQERAERYRDDFTFWSHHAAEYTLGLRPGIISVWIYDGRLRSRPTSYRKGFRGLNANPLHERDSITMGEIRPLVMAYRPRKLEMSETETDVSTSAESERTTLREKLKARRSQEREAAR